MYRKKVRILLLIILRKQGSVKHNVKELVLLGSGYREFSNAMVVKIHKDVVELFADIQAYECVN